MTNKIYTDKKQYWSSSKNAFISLLQVQLQALQAIVPEKFQSSAIIDKYNSNRIIENYIYLYHLPNEERTGLGLFLILPTYPDSYTDSLQSQFSSVNILARSAPIYSYSYSGPRSITINLSLHRDMMTLINFGRSNLVMEIGDDYVDTLINKLQTIALPKYDFGSKMINPPMVAIRFGNEFFIKGVVTSGITTTSTLPLLRNGKYAQVSIQFTVNEVDPYDAEAVAMQGAMRGLNTTLERNLYKSKM